MKKSMLILATVLLCAFVMSLFSCNKQPTVTTLAYHIGFQDLSVGTPSSMQEMDIIDNAFKTAFRQELGVSVADTGFSYSGGDDKVKAACEKAAQTLKDVKFSNKYTYVVTREGTSGTVILYTWRS